MIIVYEVGDYVWVTMTQESFQERVQAWVIACLGEELANDRCERNHRFLEEALELVQAAGATKEECLQLVDYVYGRPIGEPTQEVGGVMVTLAALCSAHGISVKLAAEHELVSAWKRIDEIRKKNAAKPKLSPLPGPSPKQDEDEDRGKPDVDGFYSDGLDARGFDRDGNRRAYF